MFSLCCAVQPSFEHSSCLLPGIQEGSTSVTHSKTCSPVAGIDVFKFLVARHPSVVHFSCLVPGVPQVASKSVTQS